MGAVALALMLRAITAASAQAAPLPPAANARDRAAAEGDASLDRLKQAVAGRKAQAPTIGPILPGAPAPDLRRRVFDAIRKRAPSPAMDSRARAALATGQAALVAQRDAMARRLGQALGLDAPDMTAVADGAAPKTEKSWVPVLFVSSSMPIPTLRHYAAQLEPTGGVLAFRGMPGGLTRVAPMAKLSAEILRIDPGCEGPSCAMRDVQLIVDPILFRSDSITRVPALTMIPGDPTRPYCERDDDSPRSGRIVFGDAALAGMLDEYARLGGKEEVRDAQARMGPR